MQNMGDQSDVKFAPVEHEFNKQSDEQNSSNDQNDSNAQKDSKEQVDSCDDNIIEFMWKIRKIKHKLNSIKGQKTDAITSELFCGKVFGQKYCIRFKFKEFKWTSHNPMFFVVEYEKPLKALQHFLLCDRKITFVDQNGDIGDCEFSFRYGFLTESDYIFKEMGKPYSLDLMTGLHYVEKLMMRYTKNDTVKIKVSFMLKAFWSKLCFSHNGTLIWRIDDYSKKKQLAIDLNNRISSQPFYSSDHGFRFELEVYLAMPWHPHDNVHCLVLKLIVVRGEWDEDFKENQIFPCKIYYCMADQSDSLDKKHIIKKNVNRGNIVYRDGIFALTTVEEMESGRYIQNDSILLKVTVKPM